MTDTTPKKVPERLIEAAEKLFCEKGYEQTSVRDLTNEANCNIASVNYHFGGKDKLYIDMFRKYIKEMVKSQTENINNVMSSANPTLEQLFKTVAETALEPLKKGQYKKSTLRFLIRETLNPHLTEEVVSRDLYEDLEKVFIESIVKLTPGLKSSEAILSRFSFDGILMIANLYAENYFMIFPEMTITQLVDHIVKFSCGGVRALVE